MQQGWIRTRAGSEPGLGQNQGWIGTRAGSEPGLDQNQGWLRTRAGSEPGNQNQEKRVSLLASRAWCRVVNEADAPDMNPAVLLRVAMRGAIAARRGPAVR